jgi:hypothetical protein
MTLIMRRANRRLDGIDRAEKIQVLAAVTDATTLGDAAERAGLLDEAGGFDGAEARAALDALPGSVSAALLAVLRDAVERDAPLVLQWKPGGAVELQVWEAMDGDVGQIGVLLISPYGRELAAP